MWLSTVQGDISWSPLCLSRCYTVYHVGIMVPMLKGCESKRNSEHNCSSLLTALPLQAPKETVTDYII